MQLSNKNLVNLQNINSVITPQYDRSQITCGIMHMSIGGFHRSHQAVYIDNILSQGHTEWGICAIGLMPQDKENIESLKQQDTLYTVLERSAEADTARIIGSITEVIHAPSAPDQVLERLSNEQIKILSLTITEKGYCYDSNKNLDENNDLIQHDLKNIHAPKTALGYIVAGLKERKDNIKKPFTVMSCDNLPENGNLTKKLVLQFATLIDINLKTWIEDNVRFPNAMVDRITPVTTDEIIKTIQEKFTIDDAWPVICEDYIQWILEDDFCNTRPPLEDVGVQIVNDVDPYEKMKVRLLNGSHSALSYISYLMGYREVDTAMNDPLISNFVRNYMDHDVTSTLPDVPGINLKNYKEKLIVRFSNPAISDQIQRLAEDGSQKIPNAILPCLKYKLENNEPHTYTLLAIACWFKYLTATDEVGDKIIIKDLLADKLTSIAQSNPEDLIELLTVQEVFGEDLIRNESFVLALSRMINNINTEGTKATLERLPALGPWYRV